MITKIIITTGFALVSSAALAHGGHTDVVAGHSHFIGEFAFELALVAAALGAVTLAILKK